MRSNRKGQKWKKKKTKAKIKQVYILCIILNFKKQQFKQLIDDITINL